MQTKIYQLLYTFSVEYLSVYTEELATVIYNVPAVLPHFYADDTQLLMSTRPDGVTAVCRVLEQCVCDVQTWVFQSSSSVKPSQD